MVGARHLISLDDLSDTDLRDIVERGAQLGRQARPSGTTLAGTVVGVYFRKTSTRTRTAFASGALRLGAGVVRYGPGDLQLNTGESSEDTGHVLSGMLDVLVARTAGSPSELRAWAGQERMAVINAMTADEHPTQALADLTTLTLRFGAVDGLRVLYVGEGNNTAVALGLGLSRYPRVHFELRTPPDYGLPREVRERAAGSAAIGSTVRERHDLDDLPRDVDVVYTTRWQTTGTSKPDADWRTVFAPFQVTSDLMDRYPQAVFMHDLPAHRGDEVCAAVLDGPASIAFDQAEHKMHSAMAVLEWCVTNGGPSALSP